MSSRISTDDRLMYGEMADVLLPAFGEFPSAQAAGVAGNILDDILNWRPDIAPDFMRGMVLSRGLSAEQAIKQLKSNDEEAFEAIRVAVFGAYYLNETVMNVLHYKGQQSNPVSVDEKPDYLSSGLLNPVSERGEIWRKT